MKKKSLVAILSVILVLIIGGVAVYATGFGDYVQGKIFKAQKCDIVFENFDPNPDTVVDYGDTVDFKWNGPGCPKSGYKFKQYMLCFKNVNNEMAYHCIGELPNTKTGLSNHYTLSEEDWRTLHNKTKNGMESGQIDLKWYVMSYFGTGLEIKEQLSTRAWTFSYVY